MQKFDDFKKELTIDKSNNTEDFMDAEASITENAEAILNLNKKIATIEDSLSNDLDSKLNQKLSIKIADSKNEVDKLSSMSREENEFLENEIDFLHKHVVSTAEDEQHLVEEVRTYEHQVTDFSDSTLNAMTTTDKVLAEIQQKQLFSEEKLAQLDVNKDPIVVRGILDDIKIYMPSIMLKDSAIQIMQNADFNRENKNFFAI